MEGLKSYCYLIFVNIIIDYEEQVFIIGIKAKVQYSVYYIFL